MVADVLSSSATNEDLGGGRDDATIAIPKMPGQLRPLEEYAALDPGTPPEEWTAGTTMCPVDQTFEMAVDMSLASVSASSVEGFARFTVASSTVCQV